MQQNKLLTLFLAMLIYLPTQAGNMDSTISDSKYIHYSIDLAETDVKDEINTSLPYAGINIGNTLEYFRQKKSYFFSVSNTYIQGSIYPYLTPDYSNQIAMYYDKINVQFLLPMLNSERFFIRSYIGPEVKAQGGMRINYSAIGNSSLSYEGSIALQLAARGEKRFSLYPLRNPKRRRNFGVSYHLAYPLFAKVWTPPYTGMADNSLLESPESIDFSSNYSSFIYKYVNVEVGLKLHYYLKNKNAVGLSYLYNYTATYPEYNQSKSLNRFIGISLLYNIK